MPSPPAQEEDETGDHGRAYDQDGGVEPRDLEVGQVLALELADEQAQAFPLICRPRAKNIERSRTTDQPASSPKSTLCRICQA